MEQLRTNLSPLPLADIVAIARQRNGGAGAIPVYGSQLASDLRVRRAPLAEPRDLRHHDAASCDSKHGVVGRVATRTHPCGHSPVDASGLFTPPGERRAA